jgi:hypothetical protein
MALVIIDGPTIAAGQSLSDVVDCTTGTLIRIHMPVDWTAGAVLTFQSSADNTVFRDLFDHMGNEHTMNVVKGVAVLVPIERYRRLAYLKFRSGPRAAPLVQAQQRRFGLVLDKL